MGDLPFSFLQSKKDHRLRVSPSLLVLLRWMGPDVDDDNSLLIPCRLACLYGHPGIQNSSRFVLPGQRLPGKG